MGDQYCGESKKNLDHDLIRIADNFAENLAFD